MTGGELTDRQREIVDCLPATQTEIAEELGVKATTVDGHINRIKRKDCIDIDWRLEDGRYVWHVIDEPPTPDGNRGLEDVEPTTDPSPEELTQREEYIARELQTGATVDELAADLDERDSVVTQHLEDLRSRGWQVYFDDDAEHYAIEGDHLLRSSEHTGTRTRKANRWWELRHNELVREFRDLSIPTAHLDADAGHEDWVLHLTDLHAGDRVRRDDGTIVYETAEIPDVIDYTTEQALALADKHDSTYDAAHVLWGGDMVTNEGIYEGQFEDLDAWLDEQHMALVEPLLRQVKAFAERFPTVQVVCVVGNHGQHRASGTSRQANADLILYKHLRNTVAELRKHAGLLENVSVVVGDAKAYRNVDLRGGKLRGHLRHGQDRRPQAETNARKSDWRGTLLDHEFDIAWMGHHHISGRIPWDGPPIICSPSPKPAGDYVEKLGGRMPQEYDGIATCHGVSDDGLTSVFPIDTRHYD